MTMFDDAKDEMLAKLKDIVAQAHPGEEHPQDEEPADA